MVRDAIRLPFAALERAVAAGLLSGEQARELWQFLSTAEDAAAKPRFDVVHLLWYAGALIVIAAMGLFTTEAWQRFGAGSLVTIAAIYGAAFALAGEMLWRRGLRIPGGLLITVAVTMAPLAVFGVQEWIGPGQSAYRLIKSDWAVMDVAAIVAGAAALARYRFGFLLMPVAVALWFLSMDVVQFLAPGPELTFETRKLVSLVFGAVMMLAAWAIDVAARKDFAFWLHLFGLMAGWGGLTAMDSHGEVGKAVYCALNIGLLFASVFLQRRAYAVFGGMGVTIYLGHLAGVVFKDSLMFSFALSIIGIAVIVCGLWFHKHRRAIETWLTGALPAPLKSLRPAHARVPPY